jgi:hypothetical protein
VTDRWSYQLIWEKEVKPRLAYVSKTELVGGKTEIEPNPLQSGAKSAPAISQDEEKPVEVKPPPK